MGKSSGCALLRGIYSRGEGLEREAGLLCPNETPEQLPAWNLDHDCKLLSSEGANRTEPMLGLVKFYFLITI